jgi:hypothetical protein
MPCVVELATFDCAILRLHYVSKELDNSWAVANEATVLADFRRLIDGWQAQTGNALQDDLAIVKEEGCG